MTQRLLTIAGVAIILLIGVAIGARLNPPANGTNGAPEACLDALAAADTVADMLEAVAPNPGASFDLTYHQLVESGYRDHAAACRQAAR